MKSLAEQIASVKREIQMRKRVYAKWVGDGRLSQENAAHEIECMESVLATLEAARSVEEIAAAPDLYAAAYALQSCIGAGEHLTDEEREGLRYLRAALAKARGEE